MARDWRKKLTRLLFAVTMPWQLPNQTGNSGKFLTTNGSATSWGAAGSVSSVSLNMPAIFAVSGSPITGSGTFAVTFNTQTANTVFAGPTSGGAATPTFRALVAADLPSGTINGSLTSTRIPYASGSATLSDSANHTWDNANNTTTLTNNSLGTTQKDSILLQNTTAAANNSQQISPSVHWSGKGWKTTATAASQVVDWRADVLPIQGTTNPYSKWRLRHSANSAAYSDIFSIDTRTSTTDSNPKFNLGGRAEFTFSTTYTDDPAIRLTNSNSSGYITSAWRFGSTDKYAETVESSGQVTFRAASQYDFQTGNPISLTYSRMSISSSGVYTSGMLMSFDKAVLKNASVGLSSALNVGGGYSIKGVTITGDTTLSNTLLEGGVYYCDTTNSSTCQGTPSTACSGYSYAACASHTLLGCSQVTQGACSEGNYTDGGTCAGLGGGGQCTWETSACSAYNNDYANCNGAGWPSGSQCGWTGATCADFYVEYTPGSCPTGDSCSATYGGDCSALSEGSCNAHNVDGCTTNYGDCHAWDGTDQGTCEAQTGCAWDSMNNLCNGTYYSSCSGSYYTSCDGSYSGVNGTCSGTFDTGICGTGNYGYCSGSAACSNLTSGGSGVCTGYTGCSWVNGLTITLPDLSTSTTVTADVAPLLHFKKINSGAGSCTIARQSTDTIEGSTSTALTTQYDKVSLHGRYYSSTCNEFTNNRTSCEATTGCSWPQCSSYNADQATCEAVNGCIWSDPDCTGTVTPNGTCSGSYIKDRKWYKF